MSKLNKQARFQQLLNDLRMSNLIKCPIAELLPFEQFFQEHNPLQKVIKQ
jgi:hypothetical protein